MSKTYKMSDFAKSNMLNLFYQPGSTIKSWFTVIVLLMTFNSFSQILVGSGNTTNTTGPWSSCWGYSYHQMIYPQDQIGTSGTITSLTYTVTGTLPTSGSGGATPATPQGANTDFKIYMGHTSKSDFSGSTDWIPVDAMSLVFDGTLTMPTQSGNTFVINLQIPFEYNNSDNLVIAFDENSPGYSCSFSWVASNSQTNRNIYFRSDSANPDPNTPPSGSRSSTTPQVTLGGLVASNPPSCVTNFAPADMATDVPLNADFTWTNPSAPAASSYDVYFGTDAEPMLLGNFMSASEASNALPSLFMTIQLIM